MYERPTPTAPCNDTTGIATDDSMAYRLLHELRETTRAVETIAYNLRVITHLLATSDHRHLHDYADDLVTAVHAHEPTDVRLRAVLDEAARAWGIAAGRPISTIVAAAPGPVHEPLHEALTALQSVTEEMQSDGLMATTVLDQAALIVSRRARELESTDTQDPRYAPPTTR